MDTDDREAELIATIDQLMTLGIAMQLDQEALVQCLAFSTAKLLAFVLVKGYSSPADIDATLGAYGALLRAQTLDMIQRHDTREP